MVTLINHGEIYLPKLRQSSGAISVELDLDSSKELKPPLRQSYV